MLFHDCEKRFAAPPRARAQLNHLILFHGDADQLHNTNIKMPCTHTYMQRKKTEGMLMKSQLIEWLASCERGGRGLERKAVSTQSLNTQQQPWRNGPTQAST